MCSILSKRVCLSEWHFEVFSLGDIKRLLVYIYFRILAHYPYSTEYLVRLLENDFDKTLSIFSYRHMIIDQPTLISILYEFLTQSIEKLWKVPHTFANSETSLQNSNGTCILQF